MQTLNWMKVAADERGIREVAGKGDHPRILEYHAATRMGPKPDSVPWCASFVNWVLRKSGIEGTNSPSARSFLLWGSECSIGMGAIAVFDSGGGKGHVGFVAGYDRGFRPVILGGNQGDAVNLTAYPFGLITSFRIPDGMTPAPLPLVVPDRFGGSTR